MFKLFKKKQQTKIYDNVQNFRFDTVCALLASGNKVRDPVVTQSVAAMGSCVAATSGLTGTKESDWGFPEADWCASLGECAMVSLSPCPKPTANV